MHPWLLGVSSWLTEGRTSIFSPKGTPAHFIFVISIFVLAITLVIFIVVASHLTYVLIRYHYSATSSDQEPVQIYRNDQLALCWTVVPALLVLCLLLTTARVIYISA